MRKDWGGKWAVDTNILVYALDKKSLFFSQTEKLFSKFEKEETLLYTAQQNVLEAENVLINTYEVKVEEAVKKIKRLLEAFDFGILTPLPTTLVRCNSLAAEMKSRNIFDLYLAATLVDNKIGCLVTANDKDFKNISNLKVVNPYDK